MTTNIKKTAEALRDLAQRLERGTVISCGYDIQVDTTMGTRTALVRITWEDEGPDEPLATPTPAPTSP